MDQIKTIVRRLSKYSFWIGCGVVLLISMASWYVARGSLQKQFLDNKGKIDASFTTVKTLKGKPSPPNEHSNKAMDALNAATLTSVVKAWAKQYSFQEGILVWPLELGPDFVSVVRPLKPIETKVEVPTPTQKEIKVDFRQRYANYVERLLPRLAEVVGSVWMPGGPTAAMNNMPGMPGSPLPNQANRAPGQVKQPLVQWETGDQGRLLGAHFNWSSQPDGAPTTLQVLYAQEDLWVLTALMFIIREANGEIEGRHEAVVKTIESVMIGRSAVGRAGQVITPSGGQTPGMGPGMTPGMGPGGETGTTPYGPASGSEGTTPYNPYGEGMAPGAGPGMPPGMGPGMGPGMPPGMGPGMDPGMPYGGGMATVAADPADYRYVGNDYKPLPASRVREAMKTGKPEDAFLVVAKRMPVRLRLTVDVRKLHRLLTECGNAKLPVEIRQVRINRSGQSGGGMPGGYGMPGYGPTGGMEMMGGAPGGYGSEGGTPYGPGYGGGTGYGMTPGMAPGMEMGPGYGGPGYGSGYDPGGAGLSPDAVRNRTQISSTSSFDIPVEIYGIIYIYNPVDQQRLGVPDTTQLTGPVPAPPGVSG